MRISILISNLAHPIVEKIEQWIYEQSNKYEIEVINNSEQASGGEFLFLISCNEKINQITKEKYKYALVLHASDLPLGRGWSPQIWQIIEGRENITVSLLSAEESIDSGDIWHKKIVKIPKNAIWDEINSIIFDAEIQLLNFAIKNYSKIIPQKQSADILPTFYKKRSIKNSELDPKKTIEEQFDLIRTCDPFRYPAHITIRGRKFKIILERMDSEHN